MKSAEHEDLDQRAVGANRPDRAIGAWLKCLVVFALLSMLKFATAQSTDPAQLRRIIDQKNAEAAAATWGDWKASPPVTPPDSSSAASQTSSAGSRSDGSGGAARGSGGLESSVDGSSVARNAPEPGGSDSAISAFSAVSGDASSVAAIAVATPSLPGVLVPKDSAGLSVESRAAESQARQAEITYKNGVLLVKADDSSLKEILSRIAALTGMTVQGSVADERVFGSYGPSKPATILSTLLQGTSSNMLLVEGPHATVRELTLTTRLQRGTETAQGYTTAVSSEGAVPQR